MAWANKVSQPSGSTTSWCTHTTHSCAGRVSITGLNTWAADVAFQRSTNGCRPAAMQGDANQRARTMSKLLTALTNRKSDTVNNP